MKRFLLVAVAVLFALASTPAMAEDVGGLTENPEATQRVNRRPVRRRPVRRRPARRRPARRRPVNRRPIQRAPVKRKPIKTKSNLKAPGRGLNDAKKNSNRRPQGIHQ